MGLFSFFAEADNRKSIKRLQAIVEKVNANEQKFINMSDDELRGMTDVFRDRIKTITKRLTTFCPKRLPW